MDTRAVIWRDAIKDAIHIFESELRELNLENDESLEIIEDWAKLIVNDISKYRSLKYQGLNLSALVH